MHVLAPGQCVEVYYDIMCLYAWYRVSGDFENLIEHFNIFERSRYTTCI